MTPIERAMAQAELSEKAFNLGMTVEEYRKNRKINKEWKALQSNA